MSGVIPEKRSMSTHSFDVRKLLHIGHFSHGKEQAHSIKHEINY